MLSYHSQPQLQQLAQQLSAGQIPAPLQSLTPAKIGQVRQLLAQYLQV